MHELCLNGVKLHVWWLKELPFSFFGVSRIDQGQNLRQIILHKKNE